MSSRYDEYDDQQAKRRALKEGEWACVDAKCATVNSEMEEECTTCGKPKPRAKNRVGKEIGKELADKSKGLFAAEDWVCSKCGNVNWARRKTCNVCNAPKLADLERRTGYGGGYMDRQDVEYVKRDYDEQFDEFGRKKKRSGQEMGSSGLEQNETKDEGELEEEEEEEENEEDMNKYKLGSDMEDEEDDDDLDKYDLTADPEISEKKIEIIKKKEDEESDCSCSCSGGECSCEDSDAEREKDRERERKLKSHRDRDKERSEREDREKRRSKERSSRRSRSRDRSKEKKRSRSRDRKRNLVIENAVVLVTGRKIAVIAIVAGVEAEIVVAPEAVQETVIRLPSSFPNNFSENSTNTQSGFTGGNLGDRDRNTLVDDNVSVGSSGTRFFSVSYFQQYFDVDTDQVVKRILNSVVPTNNNFILDFVQPLPDLWGPFWISVTLVFSIGIFGNIAQYIENDGVGNYGSDFRLVTTASTLIFLYVVFVPMILFGILWHRKSDLQYPYFDIVCAYGYSLTIFIPVSLLWMLNVNWFRWALIFVSVTLSGGVLAKAIYPAFKNDSNRLVALGSVLMVFLLHFLLAFAFKEMFFDAVHPLIPEPPVGGASQTLGNHTMLAANGTSPTLSTILSTTALPISAAEIKPNETVSVPSISTAAIAKNITTTTTTVSSTKAAAIPNTTSISNSTLATKVKETTTTITTTVGANATTKTP